MPMTRTRRLLTVNALVLCAAAGCHCCDKKKKGCDTCPPMPPPGAPIIAPAPGGPPGGATLLPPAPPPPGVPTVPAAPPPSFPSGSGFPPVASFYPTPGVHLTPPDSVAQATQPPAGAPPADSPAVKLLPPEFGSSSTPPPPAAPTPPASTPSLPVGIVDFAPAIPDRVSAGRKPALEGLDWLKANGYKSVVMVRRPGESDTADRKQVEARGLAFTSIEVSPETLSWMTVDAFAKLVSDPATQPLFVYDADGSLSGGLWYLYFRRVERLSDEAARLRAIRLGLKETANGPHRDMWVAVQRLLGQV